MIQVIHLIHMDHYPAFHMAPYEEEVPANHVEWWIDVDHVDQPRSLAFRTRIPTQHLG
jgi:hypothetical protein